MKIDNKSQRNNNKQKDGKITEMRESQNMNNKRLIKKHVNKESNHSKR